MIQCRELMGGSPTKAVSSAALFSKLSGKSIGQTYLVAAPRKGTLECPIKRFWPASVQSPESACRTLHFLHTPLRPLYTQVVMYYHQWDQGCPNQTATWRRRLPFWCVEHKCVGGPKDGVPYPCNLPCPGKQDIGRNYIAGTAPFRHAATNIYIGNPANLCGLKCRYRGHVCSS